MKRAVWVAIATGTMISGAAAIGVDTPAANVTVGFTHGAATLESARQAQRDAIEARYQVDRARCDALGGIRRDTCLIDAHARKGRAMLEAAEPYAERG